MLSMSSAVLLTSVVPLARPCPFYSQGRCVFAESCGFLHDVKVKSPVSREHPIPRLDAESSRDSTSSMGTIVQPPRTVAVHSPTSSPSSTRSPRMTSLLSALRGIIGPDNTDFPAPGGDILSLDASDLSRLPPDAAQSPGRTSRGHLDDVPVQVGQRDVANATSPAVDDNMPEDLQSDSISHPGLLSPVQIGSVPPVPFPYATLGLGITLSRGDSIDSGYGETWVGPTPFSLSPPLLSRRGSTLDLLSSPFGSPLSRVMPRRFSPSPTRRHSCSRSHASIHDALPTLSTTAPQNTSPSHSALDSGSLMYSEQARQSPLHVPPSGQGGAEDANPSNETLGDSDPPVRVPVRPSTEALFFPADIPSLQHPASIEPHEHVGHITYEESPHEREVDASSAAEQTVETFSVSELLSSVNPSHTLDGLPSTPPSKETKLASPLLATRSLQSPVSLKSTTKVQELDYEALYQTLVMSPEEAASKRMSWASRLSSTILPPRAASAGISSATGSTSELVDIPERPHSAVGALPWSHEWDLRVAPVPVSEFTSRTSSPLVETPMSSGSSQADAPAPSVHTSPVSLSAPGAVAHSPSTSTPKRPWLPSSTMSVFASSRDVTSALDKHAKDHAEAEPAKSKWNRVSTSRRVPFGFRHSLVVCSIFLTLMNLYVDVGKKVDGGHPPAVSHGARKRPSVLTLPPVPIIDKFETLGSARSSSSEPSWSRPSWARPFHLVRSPGFSAHPPYTYDSTVPPF